MFLMSRSNQISLAARWFLRCPCFELKGHLVDVLASEQLSWAQKSCFGRKSCSIEMDLGIVWETL